MIEELKEGFPRTASTLARWLLEEDAREPFSHRIKGKFEDWPIEVQWGYLYRFFLDRGFLITAGGTSMTGMVQLNIYRRRPNGRWGKCYHTKQRFDPGTQFWRAAITSAWREHEKHSYPTKVDISVDKDMFVVGLDPYAEF